MRTSIARAYCIRPLLAAALGLAIAFTIGCEEKSGGTDFTDPRDSKKYRTVKIGTQTWMAQNLNYDAKGSKCYDNKPANCQKYGRLYAWKTALSVCPEGWHLPSKEEWQTLVDIAGGNETGGAKLKAKSGWNDYEGKSGNGTDEYGFAALPGGDGGPNGVFGSAGGRGIWWSDTEHGASYPYFRYMGYGTYVGRRSNDETDLYSVRCVKNRVNA